MGFWNVVTGRSAPVRPQLDALFGIPGATIQLGAALDIAAIGYGAVCYRKAEGPAFLQAEQELVALLDSDEGPAVERQNDGYGFTWLVIKADPMDPGGLSTDLHAVNTSLQDQGFARSLLCSVVAYRTAEAEPLGLVYRYASGTFYPFAPTGPQQRNSLLELNVKTTLTGDLPIEPEIAKWMPIWGCPVLEPGLT